MRFKITIIYIALYILIISGCSPSQENLNTPSIDDIKGDISQVINISEMYQRDADDLEKLYDIDSDQIEQFTLYTAPTNIQADELTIIKVKDSQDIESIKEKINSRLEDQAISFKDYLPEEYDIIQKSVLVSKGNYILFVISENADQVEEIFNKSIK